MLRTLAISNYRSLRELVVGLGQLNVITGPNGSGKSNLYRALRLLSQTATGRAGASLANEGGLDSVLWAGPENHSREMKDGTQPIAATMRRNPIALKLGFAADDFSYSIEFGLTTTESASGGETHFTKDPEIKRECIWHGPRYRRGAVLLDRKRNLVLRMDESDDVVVTADLAPYESLLSRIADPIRAPEALIVRDAIQSWRFYDHFRTDARAPARQMQVGTRTPVLDHDGHDLAAALQTIIEDGDRAALRNAIADAFPGGRIEVHSDRGRFWVEFQQHGLLRPLDQSELSDGTLRFLLWVAALLTPRPPSMMVLNEPETSLHPDLLPALARLILKASEKTQMWVVSHASQLTEALAESPECTSIVLAKELGATCVSGQGLLTKPTWDWPPRN